jgi:hypothetical protein
MASTNSVQQSAQAKVLLSSKEAPSGHDPATATILAGKRLLKGLVAGTMAVAMTVKAAEKTVPTDEELVSGFQSSSTTQETKTKAGSNPLQDSSHSDPFLTGVYELVDKSAEIYEHFQKNPGSTIPELTLLTEANWIELGENADLSTPHGIQVELAKTRIEAKSQMMASLHDAIRAYLDDHPGTTHQSFSELKPYIKPPISDAMLARYEIFSAEEINSNQLSSNKKNTAKITIREIAPVNAEFEKPGGLIIKGRTASIQGSLKGKALFPPKN